LFSYKDLLSDFYVMCKALKTYLFSQLYILCWTAVDLHGTITFMIVIIIIIIM